jgi:hypothetical protein
MFKAAYKTDFYRAVRDALHAEVNSWSVAIDSERSEVDVLWRRVYELEPISRDADAFAFSEGVAAFTSTAIVPVEHLATPRGV